MAAPQHLLYTPENAARSLLAATRYKSTLARLVSTDFSGYFGAGTGAKVTVKRPVMLDKARKYTAADRQAENSITYSDLYQAWTTVEISDQIYQAVKLPDDFTTFTLTSLESEVLAPMADTVAEAINEDVAAAFGTLPSGLTEIDQANKGDLVGTNGTSYADLTALRADGATFEGIGVNTTVRAADLTATYRDDTLRAIRSAHQLLGQRGVPLEGRSLVVGANWEAALLGLDNLNKVNEAGSPSVLRESTLGRLYGFNVIVDYSIGANDAFAFQKEAVTLVTRTTAAPRGAAFSASIAADGFNMRYLQDYDPNILTDRAVVDLFVGAEVLDPQRAVRLVGADTIVDPAPAPEPTP